MPLEVETASMDILDGTETEEHLEFDDPEVELYLEKLEGREDLPEALEHALHAGYEEYDRKEYSIADYEHEKNAFSGDGAVEVSKQLESLRKEGISTYNGVGEYAHEMSITHYDAHTGIVRVYFLKNPEPVKLLDDFDEESIELPNEEVVQYIDLGEVFIKAQVESQENAQAPFFEDRLLSIFAIEQQETPLDRITGDASTEFGERIQQDITAVETGVQIVPEETVHIGHSEPAVAIRKDVLTPHEEKTTDATDEQSAQSPPTQQTPMQHFVSPRIPPRDSLIQQRSSFRKPSFPFSRENIVHPPMPSPSHVNRCTSSPSPTESSSKQDKGSRTDHWEDHPRFAPLSVRESTPSIQVISEKSTTESSAVSLREFSAQRGENIQNETGKEETTSSSSLEPQQQRLDGDVMTSEINQSNFRLRERAEASLPVRQAGVAISTEVSFTSAEIVSLRSQRQNHSSADIENISVTSQMVEKTRDTTPETQQDSNASVEKSNSMIRVETKERQEIPRNDAVVSEVIPEHVIKKGGPQDVTNAETSKTDLKNTFPAAIARSGIPRRGSGQAPQSHRIPTGLLRSARNDDVFEMRSPQQKDPPASSPERAFTTDAQIPVIRNVRESTPIEVPRLNLVKTLEEERTTRTRERSEPEEREKTRSVRDGEPEPTTESITLPLTEALSRTSSASGASRPAASLAARRNVRRFPRRTSQRMAA